MVYGLIRSRALVHIGRSRSRAYLSRWTYLQRLKMSSVTDDEKNDADVPSHDNENAADPRCLLILYATETGTAQETADRIARECRRVYFQCRVCNMATYSPVR